MNRPSRELDLLELLNKVCDGLEELNLKLDRLLENGEPMEAERGSPVGLEGLEAFDVITLLSLPDHLRKTAMILIRLGRATAGMVSKESGRARAVESGYLNQLAVMGHVNKEREGRSVFFYVEN